MQRPGGSSVRCGVVAPTVRRAFSSAGQPQRNAPHTFKAINTGVLAAQEPRSRENTTLTSFEEFVQDVFAPAYHGKGRVALTQASRVAGCACVRGAANQWSATNFYSERVVCADQRLRETSINRILVSNLDEHDNRWHATQPLRRAHAQNHAPTTHALASNFARRKCYASCSRSCCE